MRHDIPVCVEAITGADIFVEEETTAEIGTIGAVIEIAIVPDATEPGFGLFGMRERVHDLGGRLTLRSAPGQGTVVSASVPIGQGDGDATRAG